MMQSAINNIELQNISHVNDLSFVYDLTILQIIEQ